MPQKSTIIIVLGTVGFFAAVGGYGFLNDKWQHQPFSAADYIGREISAAHAMAPDAEVATLVADYVDEAGMVHSSFEADGHYLPGGHLEMSFRSPSRAASAGASPAMLGAPSLGKPAERCPSVLVSARLRGNRTRSLTIESNWRDGYCGASSPAPVRCSITQVWQRAIAAGAPHPALADISLATPSPEAARTWKFQILDRSNTGPLLTKNVAFSQTIADDC